MQRNLFYFTLRCMSLILVYRKNRNFFKNINFIFNCGSTYLYLLTVSKTLDLFRYFKTSFWNYLKWFLVAQTTVTLMALHL